MASAAFRGTDRFLLPSAGKSSLRHWEEEGPAPKVLSGSLPEQHSWVQEEAGEEEEGGGSRLPPHSWHTEGRGYSPQFPAGDSSQPVPLRQLPCVSSQEGPLPTSSLDLGGEAGAVGGPPLPVPSMEQL